MFGVRSAAPGIEKLSPRERTVLALMVSSKRSAQIAEELHISVQTVHTHRKRIRAKLCIQRTADHVNLALRHGLL